MNMEPAALLKGFTAPNISGIIDIPRLGGYNVAGRTLILNTVTGVVLG